MHHPPRFYAFWAINGPLERPRLHHQLDQFNAAGLDGVVFHPRFYPNQPFYLGETYLDEVSDTILYAKSLGLRFWLYDEDGWPSGTVGGQLLAKYPELRQQWVGLVRECPEQPLLEFQHQGVTWYLALHEAPGVDYLNPALAERFIEMTHERYRQGLDPEAFDYVEMIFSDEPEFGLGHAFNDLPPDGAIPWTTDLAAAYEAAHGEALLPRLPLLFFPGEGHRAFRVRFREFITDRFCAGFLAPLDRWCDAHGIRFTAHMKGEEHPLFQVPMIGSCHQVYRHLSVPGIDALERFPTNAFYPRQVSAAARQFGDGRCMVEAFGGSGWGVTPADFERYMLWLGNHGLTDFVLHLSQYQLDSNALQDWPPSHPLHLTWSHLYSDVLDRVRQRLATPRPVADTLVVGPYRGIMATYEPRELSGVNIHNAATYPDSPAARTNQRFMAHVEALHAAGIAYDLTDERSLEEQGTLTDAGISLGHCTYRHLSIDPECQLDPALLARLTPFLLDTIPPVVPLTFSEPPTTSLRAAWRLAEHPVNSLPLICEATADGAFTTSFTGVPVGGLALRFADVLTELQINGQPVTPELSADGATAAIPASLQTATTRLRFRTAASIDAPFAWVEGRFRIDSQSPFAPGPGQTVKTDGPFQLAPPRDDLAADLVADGFPFLREPLVVTATITLPACADRLCLIGLQADAIRLTNADWQWPVNGRCELAVNLPAGEQMLRFELVPNSYNVYGPHHYYLGDWHVVSPGQVRGERNFADPLNAPRHTHIPAWHLRRFELPTIAMRL